MNGRDPAGGAGAPGNPAAAEDAEPVRQVIAGELRRARLSRGLDLGDISHTLRIRQEFLKALEAGRFEELPGPTYISGFLKIYGDFLGFDGADLVRRLKEGDAEALSYQYLPLTIQPSEMRRPTTVIIAAALVAAAAILAGWYVAGEYRAVDPELVPEVPQADSAEPSAGAAAATTVPESPDPEAVTSGIDTAETGEETGDSTGDVDGQDTVSLAVNESGTALPVLAPDDPREGREEGTAGEPVRTASPVPPGERDREAGLVAAPGGRSGDAAGVPRTGTVAVLGTGGPAGNGDADAVNGRIPRVYGIAGASSRIEIRAIDDTWIQVEAPGNIVLLTRILLQGDVYHVPGRDGLTLDVGNAGGMEIRVDGELVPPLGRQGEVMRDIPLAPDTLLQR